MRKLSTLVLLALLASPALCLAANGPAATAPESHVIWIAVGNQPVAVVAAPSPNMEMVTICYFGVTMTVREKIARRYLRIGATCGACGEEGEEELPSFVAPSKGCGEIYQDLAPTAGAEKVIQLGKSVK